MSAVARVDETTGLHVGDSAAQFYGVYMWEYLNVIWPLRSGYHVGGWSDEAMGHWLVAVGIVPALFRGEREPSQ